MGRMDTTMLYHGEELDMPEREILTQLLRQNVEILEAMGDIKGFVRWARGFIDGDGTDDSPGLKVRIDRLERAEERRTEEEKSKQSAKILLYATAVGSIMCFIGSLVLFFVTHGK